ncbi:MAG: hypothetical protein AMJ59_06820 [Gammaproteobacteria bacterium SG8_31]|jgi:transporter family-2 protein|nr:MAG: hypothetical protein AMJ59_06820 [Gammaproteobacteria bacterium SG8_31]
MKLAYVLLAAAGGAMLPLQALINARLGAGVGGPAWAATISFLVGTLGLAAFLAITRQPLPLATTAAALPWWVWTGGLLGAMYVAFVITAVPALGATAMVAFVILGQLTASTVLDHFGILSAVRPISALRLAGVAMLFLGAVLVVRH